jgi:hypothetical protein
MRTDFNMRTRTNVASQPTGTIAGTFGGLSSGWTFEDQAEESAAETPWVADSVVRLL